MPSLPLTPVTAYYRAVAPALLPHMVGRALHPLTGDAADGASGSPHPGGAVGPIGGPHPGGAAPRVTAHGTGFARLDAPTTADELMLLLARGVTGFQADPAGRMVLRLTPGEGSDTATAATAALQLAEQAAADGLGVVPLTDGAGGLWLMAVVDGEPGATALRYQNLLTTSAPELATADPERADGRTLVTIHCGRGAGPVPLPYTLLPAPGWPAAVIPLHLDEVAAITAGMPAEIWAPDVAGRLGAHGDLAAALLRGATA